MKKVKQKILFNNSKNLKLTTKFRTDSKKVFPGRNNLIFFKNLLASGSKIPLLFDQNFFSSYLFFLKKNDLYIDNNLIKMIALDKLKKQKSYRFFRFKNNLPMRGQRTHTNSKTRKR
ncbi:MAG: hypothetical protein KDH96_04845 [Candidatus Riesia sp.]|nr:hypothetical protein [Candidatus Riesia sp.]